MNEGVTGEKNDEQVRVWAAKEPEELKQGEDANQPAVTAKPLEVIIEQSPSVVQEGSPTRVAADPVEKRPSGKKPAIERKKFLEASHSQEPNRCGSRKRHDKKPV